MGPKALPFALALLGMLSGAADACQCTVVMDASGSEAPSFNRFTYSQADIVFLGRTVGADTSTGTGTVSYRFDVEQWIKGEENLRSHASIAVQTSLWGAACGDRFEEAVEYLVLARFSGEKDRKLETDNCAGNSPATKTLLDSALAYSGSGSKGKPAGREKRRTPKGKSRGPGT